MEKEKTQNAAKTVRIILTENELLQLENLAKDEKRSVSNTVSIIVSEYFKIRQPKTEI